MNALMELQARGYNPLRWQCGEAEQCYNKILRPKIEVFFDCFPGRISFGDVDGIVEINAHGLLLEWKHQPMLNRGQHIMYKRLSKTRILSVLCVAGSAETMDAEFRAYYFAGEFSDWKKTTLEDVKVFVKQWVEWAQKQVADGQARI